MRSAAVPAITLATWARPLCAASVLPCAVSCQECPGVPMAYEAPRACTVLDGAGRVGEQWPDAGGAQVVMERLKARFDPARIFRPGAFVGGI